MTAFGRTVMLSFLVVLFVALGGWLYEMGKVPAQSAEQATSTDSATTTTPQDQTGGENPGALVLAIGQAGSAGGITITPKEVLEDSRCPIDVQCIQAGRIRLRATIASAATTSDAVFLVGEPINAGGAKITLTTVLPDKVSTTTIGASDYRFTFAVEEGVAVSYSNASADTITVDQPAPGAVVGKTFSITGKARGSWYSEAVFPVQVLDKDGALLASAPGRAQDDWMTSNFVPFSADIVIASSYTGPAIIVLKNDNPSGEASRAASASFPVTIQY